MSKSTISEIEKKFKKEEQVLQENKYKYLAMRDIHSSELNTWNNG